MKNLNAWHKLTIRIAVLSISMMALSFFTDSQLWLDYFNFDAITSGDGCHYADCRDVKHAHHHWNYRGWVYFLTGLIYFGLSVARILEKAIDEFEEYHQDKRYKYKNR